MKTNKKTIAALVAAAVVSQLSFPAYAGSTPSRYIKMRAYVGNIKAQPVTLPSGEVVDFPYVANALFYSQVFAQGFFEESNFLDQVITEVNSNTTQGHGSFSQKPDNTALQLSEDAAMLQSFGLGSSYQSAQTTALRGLLKPENSISVPSVAPADTPVCEYNQPPVKLRGQVVAYESAFGGGITVGYDQNGAHSVPGGNFGGTLDVKSQRLDMQFDAVDPLFSRKNVDAIIASVPVSKNVVDVSAAVTFNIGIPIGINFFLKGSIPKAIRGVMDKGMNAIMTELQKQVGVWDGKKGTSWKDIWESRVIYSKIADNDTTVAIAGGFRAYVQIGDQFRLTNMYWNWGGNPCESVLGQDTMAVPPLGEAIGTVIATGPYTSILRVSPVNGHEQGILPGALVRIEKLK